MMGSSEVPVIDFSVYSLSREGRPSREELAGVVRQVRKSLDTHQCFWISNTGLDVAQIKALFQRSKEFFSLPYDEKVKYVSKNIALPTGYFPDSAKPGQRAVSDLGKQGFHYCPLQRNDNWPGEDVSPGMISAYDRIWNVASDVALRLSEVIALSLDMDPERFIEDFLKGLKERNVEKNWSSIRVNQYDPIPPDYNEDGLRFSPHSDWTLFTLLFPSSDGLMMETEKGEWISVGHKSDAMLVQSGFVAETVTQGRIKPNRHRVDVPTSPAERATYRHSMVYFVYADNDVPLVPYEELAARKGDPDTKTMGGSLVELLSAYINSGNADHETSLQEDDQ